MADPSDTPCSGKIGEKISDATVDSLFCGLNNMVCYKNRIQLVGEELKKLDIEKDVISRRIATEVDSGKEIYDHVLKWQKDAEDIQQNAKEFCEKYNKRRGSILNPIARFRLSTEAGHMVKRITELTDVRKNTLDNEIGADIGFIDFPSRKDAFEQVWDALVSKDRNSPTILGIYGLAGVGKTRMLEQILTEAKDQGVFDKVIRVDSGSGRLNLINFQNDIAAHLEFQFESQDNEEHRGCQLARNLKDGGKLLIVLDQVQQRIPLYDIGFQLQSPDYKIVLTSPTENICRANQCTHLVMLKPLTFVESCDLFSNAVGAGTFARQESVARELCDKCGGLPLIIHSVGKTLKSEPPHLWIKAFSPLEIGKIESVPGISPHVYARLKLSFDYLSKKETACILLCSLFPEDADIPIRYLTFLFEAKAYYEFFDGRSEFLDKINDLVSSSMLVKVKDGQHVKLHPIFRGVTRSEAVRHSKYLFVRWGMPLPDRAHTSELLHLELDRNDVLPDNLLCPRFGTLFIRPESPLEQQLFLQEVDLAGMFENLGSLVLTSLICKRPFSLGRLHHLHTILLDHCNLFEIDVGFFPEDIETLCMWDCHLPEKLDLPDLKCLLKLEILGGTTEVVFGPNTLSSLSSLKEMHIANRLLILDDKGISVPIRDDFSQMTSLTNLHIWTSQFQAFRETKTLDNLHEYNICVGMPRNGKQYFGALSTKVIELSGYHFEGFERLVERAEEVTLRSTSVRLGRVWDSSRNEYVCWRNLYIEECNSVEYVAKMSEDEFQQDEAKNSQYSYLPSAEQLSSFSQITVLEIKRCSAIKFLFCNIAANFFVKLQQLCITDCPLMEAIVMNEGTSDGDMINFYGLKSLKLCNMPRLTSFYKQMKHMHSSSTSLPDNSIQPLFDEMVYFPSLEVVELSGLEDTSDIWSEQYLSSYTSRSFRQLKSLSITNCNRLEIVFPVAMLERLRYFKLLSIIGCSSLISEIGNYDIDNYAKISQVEALTQMHLEMLPCLAKTGLNSRNHSGPINLYPNLHSLHIKDCSSLTNVFQPSTARVLVQLKEMRVSNCKMMNMIIGAGEEEITNGIEFPDLTLLQLSLLPNLTNFWRSRNGEATYKVVCPKLVDLELSGREPYLEAIEFGRDDSPCQLTSLSISLSCDRELQLPNAWEHRLYYVETLKLRPYWSLELKFETFQRLKVLKILENGCSILFTCSVFESLQQLQELEISNCALLEVIVHYEDPVVYIYTHYWKLKLLILRDLPNLKSLVPTGYYMPYLEEVQVINCGLSALFTSSFGTRERLRNLRVSNCRLLESIFQDSRDNENWDTIFTLSSVVLKDLPNLKTFAYTANCEYLMPNLVEVQVDSCGLSTLFTSNICRSLHQLRKLEVSNCMALEGIVKGTRNDVSSSTNEWNITLYKLSEIVLENLPNLECFSPSARYDFEMPVLYAFRLVGCPRLKKFTCSKTTTGLVSVYTEGQCWEEVPDLNDYIRQKHRAGSNFNDTAGESSSSNQKPDEEAVGVEEEHAGELGSSDQKPDEEAVRVEEEQSLQETGASDQKLRKIEIQIFINSQHEVTNTKASVHHLTLLE